MPYTTLTRLLERMPESVLIDLTDDAGTGGINEQAIDRAIADADTEIDSYIGRRYVTPVVPVPDLLGRLSLDLVAEILYARRAHATTPEAVTRAAKTARAILVDIAANKADIPGLAETDTSGTSACGASFDADERLFTRSTLRGM